MTPQLALRVAVLGSFALAMFAIIFFRLWFLQVLSGNQYLAKAQTNRTRVIAIPAPRGDVVDRNGNVLVSSTKALAVQISANDMPVRLTLSNMTDPPAADRALYRRLAHILGISPRPVSCKIALNPPVRAFLPPIGCKVAQDLAVLPYANATIKTDVSKYVQYYLAERQDEFAGVDVEQVYVRDYPLHDLASQLFGTVGPINSTEIKEPRYRSVSENAIIGKTGLEWSYDHYLRGRDGHDTVQVDSLGHFVSNLGGRQPTSGLNLRLSLDKNLQAAGEAALQQAIANNYPASGGAFIALDPVTGQVYAMGSNPSFDPNLFAHNLSQATYNALNSPSSNFPLINRAIQSVGPTGSTFKPITATAALQSGAWSLGQTFDDTGQYCVSGQCRHNAGGAVDGVLDLPHAIQVSSDDFFYNLGAVLNPSDPASHPNGGALQHWASLFSIGRKTGIDLRGEESGTLPSPAWRTGRNQLEAECDNATGPFRGKPKHAPGGCGIADGTNRPWSIGDDESLAVGQGDVQVTPLQLAVAYSALANGGTIVRPHIGLDVERADGTIEQKFQPPAVRNIGLNQTYLDTIRAGLRAAASQPGGTSADVFGNFPEQVYGKTGTAQYSGQQDYSWYACFVPPSATTKPITVVVWVEQGGFGAVAAAPAAREILSQWFFGNRGRYVAGSSKTL